MSHFDRDDFAEAIERANQRARATGVRQRVRLCRLSFCPRHFTVRAVNELPDYLDVAR